jgi:CHAD domain-containing protein
MNPLVTETMSLPDRFDIDRLKKDLLKQFSHLHERRHTRELEVFDTFDWRLNAKGRLLVREGARFILLDARSDRELISAAAPRRNNLRFWWEMPDSALRSYLREVLEMRALMRLIKLKKSITALNLLDKEEKTVVRLAIESAADAGKKTSDRPLQVCKLIAVRGYRKQFKAAEAVLSSAGVTGDSGHILIAALESGGLQPGGYSSKSDIALQPDMPAGEACRRILAHLARIIQLNEDGIRKDIDSEFLHDFRVAVRRARSLLTLLKGVFDPQVDRALKQDLQAAGKATNRLRDLDVYLLDQQSYADRIPDRLRPGIAPLFTSLKRRRSAEKRKTIRFIDSAEYRRIIAHIEAVAGYKPVPDHPEPDAAQQPIKPLASRVIFKRYRKIIKAGSRIDASTPDEELHRLRIECKKLRYALEFFRTLYAAGEMKGLIKQLKSLQDNLGRFNDLSVQQDFLNGFLETMDQKKPNAVELAAATGALISRLQLEHRQVRDGFIGVFAKFHSPSNHRRYVRLFAKQGIPS